jgi:hypothetical protein
VLGTVIACGVAALSVAGCEPSDEATETSAAPITDAPAATQALEEWRKNMSAAHLPKGGCFRASHPSTTWEEVPCAVARPVPFHDPPQLGVTPLSVGNGTDDSAQVTKSLTSVVGSFPSVSGVTTESDGTANSFSLQVNTNTFTTTACSGAKNPATCQGWQQFVFSNDGTSGSVFMQYWLINYVNPCPAGWVTFNGSCFENSMSTDVPVQTIANLAKLRLTGTVASNGQDTVIMSTGSGTLQAMGQDSVLGVAGKWTFAEFNIFGNCCGKSASFNAGSTITVKIGLTNGTIYSPTCVVAGTTGETNNLNLVTSSCCPSGGASPAITFMQSNVSGKKPPFCLLNDITPVEFNLL